MRTLIVLAVALGLAFIGSFAGALYADLFLTDATSAELTVDAHLIAAKRLGKLAGISLAGLVLTLCFAAMFPSVAVIATLAFLLGLNLGLGPLAGVLASLSRFLSRVPRHDRMTRMIAMKQRCIEALRTFLLVAVVVMSLAAPRLSHAGDTCGIFGDWSASSATTDYQVAVELITDALPAVLAAWKCDSLVVGHLGGDDPRFSPRVRFDLPRHANHRDCSLATPPPLPVHAEILEWIQPFARARRDSAVRDCASEESRQLASYRAALSAIIASIRTELTTREFAEHSRVTPFISALAESRQYRVLIVASDLVDYPPADISRVRIPAGTDVVLIATTPRARFASTSATIAHIAEWDRIKGVTTLTVPELHRGIWTEVANR